MNKNAHKGANIEALFKNSFPHNEKEVEKIKRALSIDCTATIAKSYKTGHESGKADVIVRFTSEHTIGVNIKSYRDSTTGFNQAMRMHPTNFVEKFNLSDAAAVLLHARIKAKAADRKEIFIPTIMWSMLQKDFTEKANEIIRYSICGDEMPELFVLWCEIEGKMSIYLMHSMLTAMYDCMDVKLTPRGIIKFNPYFTVQRKGGNGVREKHLKTDINHGGNNIQVKISTAKLNRDIEPLCYYHI